MSTSLPFLSVVVPAYNRPAGLTALFAALEEQSYPPYRFEAEVPAILSALLERLGEREAGEGWDLERIVDE